MGTLILLRHGQSQWNLENRFTGWTDVPLSAQGEKDAAKPAEVLREFTFDIVFASRLKRVINTLEILLDTLGQKQSIICDSALNERHYGDLQGLNKAETAEKYGADQVKLWRRSYSVRPPNGESMADTAARTMPFFRWTILPEVLAGKTVLVGASGNSIRPILRHFEGYDEETTAAMEIKFCTPYIYYFEGDRVVKKEVREVPGLGAQGTADISGKKS